MINTPKRGPGRKFQKGQSGNPKGSSQNRRLKRRIKKLTTVQLDEILNTILLADPKDLSAVANQDSTVLKMWVASVAEKGIKKGDASTMLALMDRLIGKVTEKVKVDSNITQTSEVILIPDNGRSEND